MKNILTFLLIFIVSISYGQVTFTTVPLDKQLVGRDVVTNLGDVIIEGEVNNVGVTYNAIEIKLYRDGIVQNTSTQTQTLTFTGNLAPFNFSIPIIAELHNYSIKIYGKQGTTLTLEKEVVDIVAGDVYIIQGQSNAVAYSFGEDFPDPDVFNHSQFIRVYANGTSDEADLQANDNWYEGQGGLWIDANGNTGMWGQKLAKTLVDTHNIPIAIFNSAHPGEVISFFEPDSDPNTPFTFLGRNYGKLYYRLNKTGLTNKVRGVFWSQGEANGSTNGNTSIVDYKSSFINLKNNWLTHYPTIERFYVFQTKNGDCDGDLHLIKEAQRQLAFEDPAVSIIPTASFTHRGDNCHFNYANGYEIFANRLFSLVNRDLYGVSTAVEIDAPMIQSATLVNSTTLEIETDAITLSIATVAEDFLLEDASQVDITNTITSIAVFGSKIIFTLSADPGANATISYLAQAGGVAGNFITNSNGLEIICFYRYPIVPPTNVPPLLITQYYEGANNDQWIEVKNISSDPIAADVYKLVLYPDINTPIGSIDVNAPAPNHSISIGVMAPGQIRLYKNTANIAGAGEATDVCAFDGDDVILISTSIGNNCYNDRIDIVGEVPPLAGSPIIWGADKSFIKGCNTTEVPAQVFDVANYIELTTDEVDNAVSLTNIELGVHNSGSTTWTTSWDNGVSDRTRTAIISGTYTAVDGSFGACDLTVTGILNFDSGTSNYIEINKSLTNTGTITIGDQESLYTVDTLNPTISVLISGNIIKKETTSLLTDVNDYTYWSSPVIGVNISTVFSANAPDLYSQGRLYYWDQAVTNTIPGGGSEVLGEWISATGLTMEPGRGYISQGPTNISYSTPSKATVSFEGQPNTGDVNLIGDQAGGYVYPNNAVVFNDDPNPNNDLNLIGNPYPSAIDADLFIASTQNASAIEGTIWFWTHNTVNNQSATGEQYTGDDYASYNLTGSIGTASVSGSQVPTRFIGSGQGFVVQANSTVQQITFTDAMRVRSQQNVQFFKSTEVKKSASQEKDRIWLNMISSEGGASSQILIGFFDNATDNHDRLYDGIKLSAGYVNFYSKIGDTQYGIQGLSSFNSDKQVPLGFDTYIDDASVGYTISIDNLEGALNDNEVYLKDNELNLIHDLKQGDYNFSVSGQGSYTDRFMLQFTNSTLEVEDIDLNNDFIVINEDSYLLIKSNTIISQVKVYDITGRLLIENNPTNSEFRINTQNIRKGTILIVNTTFENGAEVSKRAIKY